jgi:hypothetical protein
VSTSTDAYIFYGILLDEEDKLPWGCQDDEESEVDRDVMPEDHQEWWLSMHDIRWEEDESYTDWHKRKTEFLAENTIPFEEINYCSESCPMIALAIPSTVRVAERGDPTVIEPQFMTYGEEELNLFVENIRKHKIAKNIQPRWYLASYWER